MGGDPPYTYTDTPYKASYPAGRRATGAVRNPDRSDQPFRRQIEHNQALIISIIVGFLVVFYASTCQLQQIGNKVDLQHQKHEEMQVRITEESTSRMAQERAVKADRSKNEANVDKQFKAMTKSTTRTFQAISESIDATNVEVEQVKGIVSGLDSRLSSDIASVRGNVAAVSSNLYNTNSRVSGNSARAEQIYQEVTQVAGGLENFYNDVAATHEWKVHGPGGCNDSFKGVAKEPWKNTRSFVHSRQKVTLDNCKLLCKKAAWGCKYASFYGAGFGWCYGFQSCESHTTGQGWGGYTTYARKELQPLGPPQ